MSAPVQRPVLAGAACRSRLSAPPLPLCPALILGPCRILCTRWLGLGSAEGPSAWHPGPTPW